MEVGIRSRAPLLLNGGGTNGIVKSKGIASGGGGVGGGGGGPHPMRHRHHIDIKVRCSQLHHLCACGCRCAGIALFARLRLEAERRRVGCVASRCCWMVDRRAPLPLLNLWTLRNGPERRGIRESRQTLKE